MVLKRVNVCFLILFVLAMLSLVSFVSSNSLTNLEENFQKLDNTFRQADALTREEVRRDYLRNELPAALESLALYKQMKQIYLSNSNWMNPVSLFFIGLRPSFRWGFFLAVIIFGALLIYFHNLSYVIYLFSFFNKSLRFIVFILLVLISSLISLPGYISFLFLRLSYLITNDFIKFFFYLAIFLGLFYLDFFLRGLRKDSLKFKNSMQERSVRERAKKLEKKVEGIVDGSSSEGKNLRKEISQSVRVPRGEKDGRNLSEEEREEQIKKEEIKKAEEDLKGLSDI
jgi:hypothetical protein